MIKSIRAELKAAVLATGSHLMDIHGIGATILPGASPFRASAASTTGLDLDVGS